MMFWARRADALPDSVIEADKADGFIHICQQAALSFGSNRREPTDYRPVVAIRKDGPRIVVLPCTTQDHKSSPEFYELNEDRAKWTRPSDGRKSFAHYRYEVVAGSRLKGKIGFMPQTARIDLLAWLKSRY